MVQNLSPTSTQRCRKPKCSKSKLHLGGFLALYVTLALLAPRPPAPSALYFWLWVGSCICQAPQIAEWGCQGSLPAVPAARRILLEVLPPSLVLPTLGLQPFQTGRGQPGPALTLPFIGMECILGFFVLFSLPMSVAAGAELVPQPRAVNAIPESPKPTPWAEWLLTIPPAAIPTQGLGIHHCQPIMSSQQGGNVGKEGSSETAPCKRSSKSSRYQQSMEISDERKKKSTMENPQLFPFLLSWSSRICVS